MGSIFGIYSSAYSGMYVNQTALTAASNNLANVETSGASRVRVSSTDSTNSQTGINSGTSIAAVTRARDVLLDKTYRTQNAQSSYWSVKNGNLEYMSTILEEFSASATADSSDTADNNGLQDTMDAFFSAWSSLSSNTTDESARQTVISAGTTLISALQSIDQELQDLQADAVTGVTDGVDSLNDLASQVAVLNGKISSQEADGSEASYLRDQRDSLLDEMSGLADVTVTESSGTLQVAIGGITMINGTEVHELAAGGSGTADDPLILTWPDWGCKANVSSGSIGAYMEDASTAAYSAIDASSLPYNFSAETADGPASMRQALNDLVTTLAVKVNSLHASGYNLDGETGLDFFTAADASQPLSITNITVNPVITADVDKLAVSSASGSGDNSVATAISNLLNDSSCYQCDGLSLDITDFYKAVTSWLSTAGESASSNYDTQKALVTQADTQRQSVAGISIDEEMANMIKLQNAYAASAKVMSTIDGLLEGLLES